MNNLKTYFASPEKQRSNGTTPAEQTCTAVEPANEHASEKPVEVTKENGVNLDTDAESVSQLFVVKKPSADSKLILQNMEEVLNSVKKKHRQKHRRKKEQKKLAQLEAEAVAVAVAMKTKVNLQAAKLTTNGEQTRSKKPLREKTGQVVNGGGAFATNSKPKTPTKKSELNAPSPNETILKHFQRTPKKCENGATVIEDLTTPTAVETELPKKNVKTNAFEVLMNARNKSIGSNTPGKDAPEDNAATTSSSVAATNVKRKLLLQEWSEKKGAAKRKLDDEEREAYVNKQLLNRAKRFKKMLVAGTSTAEAPEKTPKETEKNKKSKKKAPSHVQQNQEVEKEKPKLRRARSRMQRLVSYDSDDDKTKEARSKIQDSETVEFLAKLASPTKKRDSLLGYFPKKESPKVLVEKISADIKKSSSKTTETTATPKRARRMTIAAKCAPSEIASPATEKIAGIDELPNTPSGRPRRSCAGKARYDYDKQESPTKVDKNSKTCKQPKTAKPTASSDSESPVVINLDDSNSNITPQQSPTKKLAPLFVRSMPKPSPDPALLKARHAFLMSGVPEKMRLEIVKQKQYEQNYEESLDLFPKVSHVQQFSAEEQAFVSAVISISFNEAKDEIPLRKTRRSKVSEKVRGFSVITSSHALPANNFPPLNSPPLPMVPNKRNVVKQWKTLYDRFPTYKCYNQLREKYRYFSALDSEQDTEQVTESFVVTRRSTRRKLALAETSEFDPNAEEAKPPATAPNGELLFTDKYRPLLFEQFLVNLAPVSELREFLANWSAGSSGRNSQGLDDAFDFENDSNSNQQTTCNTVVLMGPSASGKTSSVFAVANELNFNVLEINAGMKRTGKKLLQELHEATQSHQIRKDTRGQGKSQNNLLKMSLNGMKSKAKQSSSQNLEHDANSLPSSPNSADATSTRKCLILIEDADIVFDQMDAGFTDAIYTLAGSSKRPVIIVASDAHCSHLQRLLQQNTIFFNEPSTMNISRYMAVLALMENCPLELEHIGSLYTYNKRNLRKTLLELQFYVQSGGDRQCNKKLDKLQEASPFFASPTKRKFSEEASSTMCTANDDKLGKEKSATQSLADSSFYTHQGLFKFYTTPQNQKWRIPFPVDFNLLYNNLDEVLHASLKLSDASVNISDANISSTSTTKRKSRSPKKVWLTAAAAQQIMPMVDLCDFYENISIACLLGVRDSEPLMEGRSPHFTDRLVPHLEEYIAHELVENSIDNNLASRQFPYNLNYGPVERINLVSGLSNTYLRSSRIRALDFEPTLRSICRSEKLRGTLERRSTRFYHYLRNCSGNAVVDFDEACSIFCNAPAFSNMELCEEDTIASAIA